VSSKTYRRPPRQPMSSYSPEGGMPLERVEVVRAGPEDESRSVPDRETAHKSRNCSKPNFHVRARSADGPTSDVHSHVRFDDRTRKKEVYANGCSVATSIASNATSTTCGSRQSSQSYRSDKMGLIEESSFQRNTHLSNDFDSPHCPRQEHLVLTVGKGLEKEVTNESKIVSLVRRALDTGKHWCLDKYDSHIWMQGALWLSLGCVLLVMFVILLGIFAGPTPAKP